jgi:hypothetical protein
MLLCSMIVAPPFGMLATTTRVAAFGALSSSLGCDSSLHSLRMGLAGGIHDALVSHHGFAIRRVTRKLGRLKYTHVQC